MRLRFPIAIAIFWCVASLFSVRVLAAEPEWSTRVLKLGEERQEVNAIPITERPYRPLHFYGNTVRRMHYRDQARPSATDVMKTVVNIVRR